MDGQGYWARGDNRPSIQSLKASVRLTWPVMAALLSELYGNSLVAQPDDGRIKISLASGARGDSAIQFWVGRAFRGNQLKSRKRPADPGWVSRAQPPSAAGGSICPGRR
jgi:hypothetical protein